MKIESIYDEVQKQCPAKFGQMMYEKAKGISVICRSCSQVLSLAPKRGNLMFNITEHVKVQAKESSHPLKVFWNARSLESLRDYARKSIPSVTALDYIKPIFQFLESNIK